jgi:acetyl-CoA C-acetyltransferase
MYARGHFEKYGTTEEDLALIRLKSSTYGQINDKAVFRKSLTLDKILEPKYIATPLKIFDCCANADGSSCVILASEEKAKDLCQKPIWIKGLGMATAPINMAGRDTFSGLRCAQLAGKRAYEMAGITASDVDVAEVHDCFTIAEMMAYEDLGFAEQGKGKDLIRNKETYKEGRIPVNVDGGLLSKGHPIGATGGSQIRTIVLQLRGEASEMQVQGAKIGLVHNIGGVGIYGNVSIFSTE